MTDAPDPAPARGERFTARLRRRPGLILLGAGLLGLGGAFGAVAIAETRPSVTMAPATPVAIKSLGAAGIVTIRGRVAEVYGNKFIIADAGGRALVDTGREGEDAALVAPGRTVTVQGRYEDGFVRAAFLVGQDGKVRALGPLHGRHDRHGPGGRQDRDDRRDERSDAPPPEDAPPPPPAARG